MGCTSPIMVESRRVVPLPPQAINSYIDKFPAIVLLKLKEKFDSYADKQTKDLTPLNFLKLYSVAKLNTEMHRRLFTYFNDNLKSNIKFRQFIVKYATIVKCEPSIFYHILFELYKNNFERDFMNEDQFANFVKIETQFFKANPNVTQFPIGLSRFIDVLGEGEFRAEDYQSRLVVTTEEDIPFKLINHQLQNCDFNDFVPGSQYYLISNAWFYRWSFYYQEADHTIDKLHIKSTKALPDQKSPFFGKRYKRKGSSVPARKLSESLRSSQLGNTLVQQPKTIDFDDIQGEYKGQLKESLKISAQIKIISQNLWKLLCSLHPAEQSFKRAAINEDTLEYYPKAIYYFQADAKGELRIDAQVIKYFSISQKVEVLLKGKERKNVGIFSKNFGEKNWREVEESQSFSEISLDPRFLVVIAQSRQKFIEKAFRKEIAKDNLQPGDNIYAHFAYVKAHSQAWIVGIGKQDLFKIHFKGFSYRYQIDIKRQEISVVEAEAALSSAKKKNQSIIKGIPNIGNTCFMNSIIQCLVSTPVLDNFLIEYPFNEKKQPIGYGLSMVAKSLMKNQKPSPQQFKRLIDVHMPLFSGYDQHDAQEFLNLLLDKLNQEIIQKPTVIDYLFAGKIKSKLTCTSCKCLKNIQEKMYILSLPIPEPQFNCYSIIIVPVTSKSLKKLVMKLPREALVSDYCSTFQERTGQKIKDFIFVQTSFNSLRKVKQEIMQPNYQNKIITDVGILPNVPLLAFEKIPVKFYSDLATKCKSQFREFQPKPQAAWTLCRIINPKNEKNAMTIEYIQESDIEKMSIDKESYQELSAPIGTKTELSYKKIILRRYNASLKRMEQFGLELLVGISKWASYNDLISIVERAIANLKEKDAVMQDIDDPKGKGDYAIRFLETTKLKCIFCQFEAETTGLEEKDLGHCCSILEKDIPHLWISKSKMFWVYVDWYNFSKCKASYCTYLQMDQTSRNIQVARQDNQIHLQTCMNLHSKAEVVEMECDSCKEKYQNLEHLIGMMPNILVVHMKEFRYTPEGHLVKLDLRLKWQEFLDSSKYSLTSSGKLYELFAVVRHSGNSQSGHYTCLSKRKHPFQNKKVWVHFDDDSTTIVRQQQKFVDDAYLLFYKKVDMPTSSLVIYSDLQA